MQEGTASITVSYFLGRLKERVSNYDARLILDSAMVVSGIRAEASSALNSEDAKNLCLELINKGGPAFHVGAAIYKEIIQ